MFTSLACFYELADPGEREFNDAQLLVWSLADWGQLNDIGEHPFDRSDGSPIWAWADFIIICGWYAYQ